MTETKSQGEAVTVPRWALEFIMRHGSFDDCGPRGEGWSSDEMENALAAIDAVLDP